MGNRYATLLCEQTGAVVTITMNRPHKLNAADIQMYLDLADLMGRVSADQSVRAVIITGAGDRAFAAGDDISIFRFERMEDSLEFLDLVARVFAMLDQCHKPIVAAVNGYALGYGFELVLACDLAVAAETARFGLPEITVGAVPSNTLTRGQEVLRRRQIAYLAMTGDEWLDAHGAHAMGLVNVVVPPAQLMTQAMQLAEETARWSPAAVAGVKRLLNRHADLHYREQVDLMPALMYGEEVREGRGAFLEKRPARFPPSSS